MSTVSLEQKYTKIDSVNEYVDEHIDTPSERAILGSLLMDNSSFELVKNKLRPEHFAEYKHRQYFKAISSYIQNGNVVDFITIKDCFKSSDIEIDDLEVFTYMIMHETPSAANISAYADIVIVNYHNRAQVKDLTLALGGDIGAINRLGITNYNQSSSTPFVYHTGYEGYNNKVNYLIKNYLPVKSMGMVFGGSGEFKSFLVTSWACHIATGIDWNGYKVNQGGVLYIVGEGGAGVPRRVKAWANTYYEGKPIPNFFRIDRPVHVADKSQSFSLIDTVRLIKTETGVDIKLIIFDTLARCFAGDENSAGQIGSFIGGIDEVKAETNVTVLIVHHSGKDATKNARGSTAITGACDFEFKVKRPNKDNDSTEFILSNTKMKDDEPISAQAFSLTSHVIAKDDDGDEITSLVVNDAGYEPQEGEETAKDKLSAHQLMLLNIIEKCVCSKNIANRSEVREKAVLKGLPRNNFDRTLKRLRVLGFVSFEDKDAHLLLT